MAGIVGTRCFSSGHDIDSGKRGGKWKEKKAQEEILFTFDCGHSHDLKGSKVYT